MSRRLVWCVWLLSDARWQHARWTEEIHRVTGLSSAYNSRLLADGASAGKLHHSHDYQDCWGWKGNNYVIYYAGKQLRYICLLNLSPARQLKRNIWRLSWLLFTFILPPAVNDEGIMLLGALSVRASVRWTRYFINCLREFHQIYNLGAVGNKDELIRFWGQKVKGQGHDQTKYDQKSGGVRIYDSQLSFV